MHSKSGKKVNKNSPRSSHHPHKSKQNLSLSKTVNKLSMSFYDDSTIRNQKQIILDSYPLDCPHPIAREKPRSSQNNISRCSSKKGQPEETKEKVLGQFKRDEMDYTTTETLKANQPEQKGKINRSKGKIQVKESKSRSKKSGQKYKKQLFLEMLQNRSKTSKGIFDLKQIWLKPKY